MGDAVQRCPPVEECGDPVVVFDPVSGWRLAAVAGTVVVGALALTLMPFGLRRRALWPTATGHLRLTLLAGALALEWALPAAVGIAWAVASERGTYDPLWNGAAEYIALFGMMALGWVIVELFVRSGAGGATPAESQLPSPWPNWPNR